MESINSLIYKLQQAGSLNLQNRTNIGTPNAGVTADEYGTAYLHTTVLTVNKAAALTLADNASLADGYLVYTLPAGALVLNSAYMSMLISNAEQDETVTDIGLGTNVATGAVAVLGGNAGFENILTGHAGEVGTATVAMDICNSTGGTGGLIIRSGNPHTVHLNVAGAWANTAGTALDADASGIIILNWTFLA